MGLALASPAGAKTDLSIARRCVYWVRKPNGGRLPLLMFTRAEPLSNHECMVQNLVKIELVYKSVGSVVLLGALACSGETEPELDAFEGNATLTIAIRGGSPAKDPATGEMVDRVAALTGV